MSIAKKHHGLAVPLGVFALAAAALLTPLSAQAQTADQSPPQQPGATQTLPPPVDQPVVPLTSVVTPDPVTPAAPPPVAVKPPAATPQAPEQAPPPETPPVAAAQVPVAEPATPPPAAEPAPHEAPPPIPGMLGVPKTEAYNNAHKPVAGVKDAVVDPSQPISYIWLGYHLGHHKVKAEAVQPASNVSTVPVTFDDNTDLLLQHIEGRGCTKSDNKHGPTCDGINADGNGIDRKAISHWSHEMLRLKYHRYWDAVKGLPVAMRFTAYAYVVNRGPGRHELDLIDKAHGDPDTLRSLIWADYKQLEIKRYLKPQDKHNRKKHYLDYLQHKAIWDCRQMRVDEIATGQDLTSCEGLAAIKYHPIHQTIASAGLKNKESQVPAAVRAYDPLPNVNSTDASDTAVAPLALDDLIKYAEIALILGITALLAMALVKGAYAAPSKMLQLARLLQQEVTRRRQQSAQDALQRRTYKAVDAYHASTRPSVAVESAQGQTVELPVAAIQPVEAPAPALAAREVTAPTNVRALDFGHEHAVIAEAPLAHANDEITLHDNGHVEIKKNDKDTYRKALLSLAETSDGCDIVSADKAQTEMIWQAARELVKERKLRSDFKIAGKPIVKPPQYLVLRSPQVLPSFSARLDALKVA